jgi:hypothetical protein
LGGGEHEARVEEPAVDGAEAVDDGDGGHFAGGGG